MNERLKRFAPLAVVLAIGLMAGGAVSAELMGKTAARVTASPAAVPPAATAPAAHPALDTFRTIAKAENPAVVNITTTKSVRMASFPDPFAELFGNGRRGMPRGDERHTEMGSGSGFIVDASGYILTNRHVVDDADKVTVTLADGKHYEARVIGKDRRTDVALLKITPREKLTALELGDSDRTEVGEWVMAVGNPFGLGGNSVTVGVVSYKGRPLDLSTRGTPVEMIQTDAAINPGNSGGPLIDANGKVIGINTLIMTQGAPQSSGVGFAVPINAASEILPQLKDKGRVVRGWLGVQVQKMDEDLAKSFKLKDTRGALVADVIAGSPAEKAGLKAGDVIVAVDGNAIESGSELTHLVTREKPGSSMKFELLREGSSRTVTVTLGTFPEDKVETERGSAGHEKLGMSLRSLTPDLARQLELPADLHGAFVAGVVSGSKAEEAGLREGDVIVGIDGKSVDGAQSLQSALEKSTGSAVLRVRRGNGYFFLTLKTS